MSANHPLPPAHPQVDLLIVVSSALLLALDSLSSIEIIKVGPMRWRQHLAHHGMADFGPSLVFELEP